MLTALSLRLVLPSQLHYPFIVFKDLFWLHSLFIFNLFITQHTRTRRFIIRTQNIFYNLLQSPMGALIIFCWLQNIFYTLQLCGPFLKSLWVTVDCCKLMHFMINRECEMYFFMGSRWMTLVIERTNWKIMIMIMNRFCNHLSPHRIIIKTLLNHALTCLSKFQRIIAVNYQFHWSIQIYLMTHFTLTYICSTYL